jgi:hypothetical protein
MKEEILREIARNWMVQQFTKYKKQMDFEVFHGKGPLSKHLRRKFHGLELTSIPNYDSVNVEPDIAGIIISPTIGQKLWVIAEVKGNENPVSQADRRQARDYAQATNAFRAFVISDGPLGADVAQDIKNGMHSFTGMFENGQKGICYLDFFRYLERKGELVKNKRERS